MKVFILGTPIWAIMLPSLYSTIEWIMLLWMNYDRNFIVGQTLNNSWASITSKPLLTKVEESTVIFAHRPIRMFKSLLCCNTYQVLSFLPLNVPPLAVIISSFNIFFSISINCLKDSWVSTINRNNLCLYFLTIHLYSCL